MKSSRLVFAITLAFLTTFQVTAFDFGLEVYNNSAYSDPGDWAYSQRDSATLWLSSPIGSNLSIYASGIYEFSARFSAEPTVIVPLYQSFDAGRISFDGSFPGIFGDTTSLSFKLGRVYIQDFSGKVIFGLNDGITSELAIGNMLVKLSSGFTGLLDKNDALIFIDEDDQASFFNDANYFASPRVVVGLGYSVSELLKGHDLGIEVWGQFDVRPTGTVKTTTIYYQPYISGRIGRTFRWNAWGIYEMGYDTALFSSFAAGGRIRATIPEALFLRITASAVWASGAQSIFRSYTPVRQSTLGSAYSALFTDAITPKLEASFTPLAALSVNAGGSLFIRNGSVLPLGYSETSTALIIGGEASGNVSFKLANDLNFILNSAIFIPNKVNAFPAETPIRWNISLGASLSI